MLCGIRFTGVTSPYPHETTGSVSGSCISEDVVRRIRRIGHFLPRHHIVKATRTHKQHSSKTPRHAAPTKPTPRSYTMAIQFVRCGGGQ